MAARQEVALVAVVRFYNYWGMASPAPNNSWFYIFLCYDKHNWDRKGFDVLVETVL